MPDRKIQRQILETLRTAYPKRVDTRSMTFSDTVGENLAYLEEHGLVDAKWSGNFAVANAKITARGIDFLSDDGGLSAILDTVVVKLHSDTIKELLISQVDGSDQPDNIKSQLKAKIRELPANAVSTIATEAVKIGLKHAPDAITWLTGLLG